MKKWKYKVMVESFHRPDLEESLNAMGQQGWEMTGSGTTGTNFDTSEVFLLFFKREILDPPMEQQIDRLAESLVGDCQSRENPEQMTDEEFNRRAGLIIGVR